MGTQIDERKVEISKIIDNEYEKAEVPSEFTEPEILYEELIKKIKSYHPSADLSMVEKAYRLAFDAHKEQKRKSGEPYIIHPLCVCIILAELELDKETIVAGLLHDVVEDTVYTTEELTELIYDAIYDFRKLLLEDDSESMYQQFCEKGSDFEKTMNKLKNMME